MSTGNLALGLMIRLHKSFLATNWSTAINHVANVVGLSFVWEKSIHISNLSNVTEVWAVC